MQSQPPKKRSEKVVQELDKYLKPRMVAEAISIAMVISLNLCERELKLKNLTLNLK
jgi:ribosomal protein L31E